ncbi:GDSL-type esterase/lipase family protein [Brevundimonas sp.]|uniref:GDSL-type esterase/lipase family protein n=1 Tax=Brevundimonas sp. TaxID=1871086 RepID=UPI0025C1CF97|nr:GDSL-type esterase/lipase family protein [Brevundimonas sp.]
MALSPPSPGHSLCPGGLCDTGTLAGLFEALAAVEAGEQTRPVHILQLGDSHTAGDRITGAVRAALQARFGRGGPGVLPPGPLYSGYRPLQVEMTVEGWSVQTAPLSASGAVSGFGLTGARAVVAPGRSLTLRLEGPAQSRTMGLCADVGPGVGAVSVRTSESVQIADFAAPEPGVACREVVLSQPVDEVTLTGEQGVTTLHDIRLTAVSGGVAVSGLGVVGATLNDLAQRDPALTALQLAAWRPDLIILAFGTNDGFDAQLTAQGYEVLLRGQIARLRALSPGTALMILGAPDALKSGLNGCGAGRGAPPGLAMVRDVQRRVAADTGVAFWDWHGRMGGDCAAERLATLSEPMMRPDRVHFTATGADWIGGMLADDLMTAFDAWKGAR